MQQIKNFESAQDTFSPLGTPSDSKQSLKRDGLITGLSSKKHHERTQDDFIQDGEQV